MGVSVGVGGGFGFLGIVAFGVGLSVYNDKSSYTDHVFGVFVMFLGVVWCLGWSAGVIIWGGVEGATIVGIIWGTGLLGAIAMSMYGTRRHASG